jgi:hypothetical protein
MWTSLIAPSQLFLEDFAATLRSAAVADAANDHPGLKRLGAAFGCVILAGMLVRLGLAFRLKECV